MEDKFEEFYEQYLSRIDKYYETFNARKSKDIKICAIVICLMLAILIFCIVRMRQLLAIPLWYFIMFILVVVVMCGLGIIKRLKSQMYEINKNIIEDMVRYISKDNDAVYEPNKRISKDDIKNMEVFNLESLQYNGSNSISTLYKNNYMSFGDMELYYFKEKLVEEVEHDSEGKEYTNTKIEKIKKYVFDGCYIGASLNKNIASQIYLIPNNISDSIINSKINEYIKYDGEKVELENLEFSKKYKVYCKDEIQARYILSLKFMENINKIDSIFEGKKYIVFKEGKRFAICIQDFKIEDIRKATLPIIRNEQKVKSTIEYMYKNLNRLFKVYEILELNNDLFE